MDLLHRCVLIANALQHDIHVLAETLWSSFRARDRIPARLTKTIEPTLLHGNFVVGWIDEDTESRATSRQLSLPRNNRPLPFLTTRRPLHRLECSSLLFRPLDVRLEIRGRMQWLELAHGSVASVVV